MKLTDNYQYLQGKQYAIEVLQSLNQMVNSKTFTLPVLGRLEMSCANKPVEFSRGLREITDMVRVELEARP